MRQQGASPDLAMAEIAARQHGVVSFAQLRSAGLSTSATARRARAGRLHQVHRGVYAVGHVALSPQGRWMAAILACGNDVRVGRREGVDEPAHPVGVLLRWGAALSHRSAAALWQLLPAADGLIDVSVSGNGGRRTRRGIRIHRCPTLLPASVISKQGIPVTTPTRTIADLRGAVSPWELRRAVRQAEVLGLPTGAESLTKRTRSDLELLFLGLCRRHKLPRPEVNAKIGSIEVDFLWRERRIVVETDGYRYHRGRVAFEDDHARDLKLRELGYEIVRLSGRQVEEDPERVARILSGWLVS